jgi:hypothetical protein
MYEIHRGQERQHLPRVRFRLAQLTLAGLLAALLLWHDSPPPARGAEQQAPFMAAQPARAFGDSVGVNLHIGWSDTPAYGDFNAVLARLRELGVRYYRDGLCPTCEEWISRIKRLGDAGIKANLITTDLNLGSPRLQENLQVIGNRLGNAVVSVEAPNEPDQTGDAQWVAKTRALQQELWTSVKGNSALARLTVLGPALAQPTSPAALGNLSAFVDRGNSHPYPGGGPPLENIDTVRALANVTSGGKQIVATEAGYHSDLFTTSGHYGTSERAIGIYMPRLALEGFRAGFERTYIYQFADPWPNLPGFENAFGLLRADLSPKPAFLTLRNLLRVVDADSAPVASPGGLLLGLEGTPADLRQLLLRSADGSYALVLWRAASVWDRVARLDLSPAPDPVDLVLGEPIALAQRFEPVDSDAEVERWTNPTRIPVAVGGSPVVVRMVPPGTPAAGDIESHGAGHAAAGHVHACTARLGAFSSSNKKKRSRGRHQAHGRHRAHGKRRAHRSGTRPKCCRAAHKAKRKAAARWRPRGHRKAEWALHSRCGNARPR